MSLISRLYNFEPTKIKVFSKKSSKKICVFLIYSSSFSWNNSLFIGSNKSLFVVRETVHKKKKENENDLKGDDTSRFTYDDTWINILHWNNLL